MGQELTTYSRQTACATPSRTMDHSNLLLLDEGLRLEATREKDRALCCSQCLATPDPDADALSISD